LLKFWGNFLYFLNVVKSLKIEKSTLNYVFVSLLKCNILRICHWTDWNLLVTLILLQLLLIVDSQQIKFPFNFFLLLLYFDKGYRLEVLIFWHFSIQRRGIGRNVFIIIKFLRFSTISRDYILLLKLLQFSF
jgi:hypothetical protein